MSNRVEKGSPRAATVTELYLAMVRTLKPLSLVALFLLGACATLPSGPSVLALPGTGKNFDQFQTDAVACKQFAYAQVGGRTPTSAYEAQQRYDMSYIQCMYAKGHRVPVSGQFVDKTRQECYPPPPPNTPPPPHSAPPR
jgi:hypothetical protein